MPISFDPPSGRKTSSSVLDAMDLRAFPIAAPDLQHAADRQVLIKMVDRSGRRVKERCDAAGGDDGERLVPLGLDARHQAFDEADVTPEDPRLHGPDGVR